MHDVRIARRAFMVLMGGSVAISAHAQTRAGTASLAVVGAGAANLGPQGLVQGLEEHGLVPGKGCVIHYIAADDALGDELRRNRIDVIFAVGSRGVHAARAATRTLPIVAIDLESEPIAEGLIERFSRPGGNLTGMFLDQPGLAAKWLQQLTETVPGVKDVAVLRQPTQAMGQLRAVRTEAARYGLSLRLFDFEAHSLDAAFKAIVESRPHALLVLSSPLVVSSRARIAELAAAARLPSTTMFRVYAEAGGLMAYGPDPKTMGHRSASFIVRILRGTPAGELPVEQPSRFELAINLRTARALGASFPSWMLAAADAIME